MAMQAMKKSVNIPLNRVEGDLEILVNIEDGVITEAHSIGTMFRGFEELMLGRGALDGLVITPRICGICSLTHLNAAAEALDAICQITPPDNARRLRNVALMAETVQNDIRHSALMFMVDFAQAQAYREAPFFTEAMHRYDPLKGCIAHEVIKETKKMPQIVAIIGGQWPHTSFMVPGGVASMPDTSRLLQCNMIVKQFRAWYERTVLGCSIETWQQVSSLAELEIWLRDKQEHRESEVGFLIRCLRESGAAEQGVGPNRFLSYGNFTLPTKTAVTGYGGRFFAAGFADGIAQAAFDQQYITEDTTHSWYEPTRAPQHPARGKTVPVGEVVMQRDAGYSWIKAPRYAGQVVETGPLAEMILSGQALYQDMVARQGATVLARQLARLTRTALLLPAMSTWLDELTRNTGKNFYFKAGDVPNGEGAGLIHAARGALGHWVQVYDQKIEHYQIITPTAWNGSPRDGAGNHGAWEQALLGTVIKDADNPIEAGHIIRSFDPCMVCSVHTVQKKRSLIRR